MVVAISAMTLFFNVNNQEVKQMSSSEIDDAVATVTGEEMRTIRRHGFSLLTCVPAELDQEDYRPPQVIDWDDVEPSMLARYIDDLIE